MIRLMHSIKMWVMPAVFLITVIAGVYFTFTFLAKADKKNPNIGKIPIPISYTAIPAYSRVSRENLDVIYLDPKHLSDDVFKDYKQVLGRVLARDKRKGYIFHEKDFLPKGTSEGVAGAIPEGKRAFTIKTDKVHGLYGLKLGDRFDLMGIFRMNKGSSGVAMANQSPSILASGLSQPTTLVENGQILVPLRKRSLSYNQSSLTRGKVARQKTVRETIIAATPAEVQSLAQAMSMGAQLYIIPRSSRDSDDESTSDSSKTKTGLYGGMGIIETMKGNSRSRQIVPQAESRSS